MRGMLRRTSAGLLAFVVLLGLSACQTASGAANQPTTGKAVATATPDPTATPVPIGLSIQGTRFSSQGHVITLVGANFSSLEYSCSGNSRFTLAEFQAMRGWGMNVVRLPLSSEFWANAGGDCPHYRQTVAQAVAHARAAGLFVILDLQWSAPFDTPADRTKGGVQCPMPDTGKDVALWQDLATLYHGDTGVLFDLYGEPYTTSWSTWLNGGTITAGCYVIGGPNLQQEQGSYQAIGMQALVAKVRAIAPENVIVLGGTDWGYDLSGITQGFALHGANLIYDTHPFDHGDKQPSDWLRAFGNTSKQDAVIASEFGAYDCGTGYIGQAISYFNAHHISWLAWNWGPSSCAGPSLLAAWPATPSVPYGAYIRQQMLAVA